MDPLNGAVIAKHSSVSSQANRVRQKVNTAVQIRLILIAVSAIALLNVNGFGEERRAKQRLVVHVPGTVTMTENATTVLSQERQIRIQATADIAVSLSTEFNDSGTAGNLMATVILVSGDTSFLRISTANVQSISRRTVNSRSQHFTIPSHQTTFLTVSGL